MNSFLEEDPKQSELINPFYDFTIYNLQDLEEQFNNFNNGGINSLITEEFHQKEIQKTFIKLNKLKQFCDIIQKKHQEDHNQLENELATIAKDNQNYKKFLAKLILEEHNLTEILHSEESSLKELNLGTNRNKVFQQYSELSQKYLLLKSFINQFLIKIEKENKLFQKSELLLKENLSSIKNNFQFSKQNEKQIQKPKNRKQKEKQKEKEEKEKEEKEKEKGKEKEKEKGKEKGKEKPKENPKEKPKEKGKESENNKQNQKEIYLKKLKIVNFLNKISIQNNISLLLKEEIKKLKESIELKKTDFQKSIDLHSELLDTEKQRAEKYRNETIQLSIQKEEEFLKNQSKIDWMVKIKTKLNKKFKEKKLQQLKLKEKEEDIWKNQQIILILKGKLNNEFEKHLPIQNLINKLEQLLIERENQITLMKNQNNKNQQSQNQNQNQEGKEKEKEKEKKNYKERENENENEKKMHQQKQKQKEKEEEEEIKKLIEQEKKKEEEEEKQLKKTKKQNQKEIEETENEIKNIKTLLKKKDENQETIKTNILDLEQKKISIDKLIKKKKKQIKKIENENQRTEDLKENQISKLESQLDELQTNESKLRKDGKEERWEIEEAIFKVKIENERLKTKKKEFKKEIHKGINEEINEREIEKASKELQELKEKVRTYLCEALGQFISEEKSGISDFENYLNRIQTIFKEKEQEMEIIKQGLKVQKQYANMLKEKLENLKMDQEGGNQKNSPNKSKSLKKSKEKGRKTGFLRKRKKNKDKDNGNSSQFKKENSNSNNNENSENNENDSNNRTGNENDNDDDYENDNNIDQSISYIENQGLIEDILTFEELIKDNVARKYFMEFLVEVYGQENLLFYLEVERFKKYKKIKTNEEILKKARQIYDDFIKKDSTWMINIDGKILEKCEKRILNSDITYNIFEEAQESVYYLMNSDSFPKFIKSVQMNKLLREYLIRKKKINF
ncbi:regulator of g protein signaling-related [Anaeramoeba flamelloides]|uniref:Regulator of g protein signaling-related n=1 Tax=Anaeramoeba flamelloides TaxID=1746091 RepID=A0AAV7ZZU5_9EUKA|nr:regulator of g protein signaling-related [Anaeramoeba flamelloides]